MKERPILFSGEMVQAILGGRKTQTRRVVKPQSLIPSYPMDGPMLLRCPYGMAGDGLWVRETWAHDAPDLDSCRRGVESDGIPYGPYYKATASDIDIQSVRWRPSIHMPRWASRIDLEITDVCVERVQDISEDDAFAEGIRLPVSPDKKPLLMVTGSRPIREWTARAYFAELWDRINAKRGYGWDKNPWVWVIKFNRIKP